MSYDVSIPKKLYKDTKLKDFDIRLYLTIAECMNDDGYTKVTNATLSYKTGKGETAIKESINRLVKREYLFKKLNAKQNNMYPQDYKRVIWLIGPYRAWRHDLKLQRDDQRQKTKENDFKLFVAYMKSDAVELKFPVDIGGLVQNYVIHKDGYLYLHATGEAPQRIHADMSMDIYKKMFAKRHAIFKVLRDDGEHTAGYDELVKRANENRDSQE